MHWFSVLLPTHWHYELLVMLLSTHLPKGGLATASYYKLKHPSCLKFFTFDISYKLKSILFWNCLPSTTFSTASSNWVEEKLEGPLWKLWGTETIIVDGTFNMKTFAENPKVINSFFFLKCIVSEIWFFCLLSSYYVGKFLTARLQRCSPKLRKEVLNICSDFVFVKSCL